MDQHNFLMKLIVILLTLTVLIYVGVYAYDTLTHPLEAVRAENSWYEESMELTGLIIRSESVLKGSRPYYSITAAHGKRVAAGDELGLAYDSEAALLRAERIESLRRELDLATAVLESISEEKSGAERAEDARSAVLSLSADIARHDTASLLADALQLRSRIFNDGESITREERDGLKEELLLLLQTEGGGTETLLSPESGVFTPMLDGCEKLTPSMLENLNVTLLQTLMQRQPSVDGRSYGKLVTDQTWYVAALLPEEKAATLQPGEELRLDFSRYRAGKPLVTVLSISETLEGQTAVTLECSVSLRDTLSLRTVNCPLITSTVTGLRIPAAALRHDANGTYVYTSVGNVIRRAAVTLHWSDGEEALVESERLHHGSEVLVGGRNLYDGKPF